MVTLRRFLIGRRKSELERMTVHEFQFGDARVRIYELWTMSPEEAERQDLTTFALVHGLGVSSRFFVPLANALAPYGRVLLFDLPGFHDLQPLDRIGPAHRFLQPLGVIQAHGARIALGAKASARSRRGRIALEIESFVSGE